MSKRQRSRTDRERAPTEESFCFLKHDRSASPQIRAIVRRKTTLTKRASRIRIRCPAGIITGCIFKKPHVNTETLKVKNFQNVSVICQTR